MNNVKGRKVGEQMDRDKVIKGLEHCTSFDDGRDKFGGVGKCGGCPYYGNDCTDRMKKDALALIDTQYKLILEFQNLISIGAKMKKGGEVE